MALTPLTDDYVADFEIVVEPSKTYALDTESERIRGSIDGKEAIKQAIYHILNVQRYKWGIYSWSYGSELGDLIGKPKSFVIPEVERLVTEALLQDDRIESVYDFAFTEGQSKNALAVSFAVKTVSDGTIEIDDMEVNTQGYVRRSYL